MIRQFIQRKRGSGYRKFILYSDKVVVESKSIRTIDRYEVRVEQLGFEIYYQRDNTTPGKIMVVFFSLLPVPYWIAYFMHQSDMAILMTVLSVPLALFSYLKPHKDDVFLTGGQKNLQLYRNVPNEEAVLEFMDAVRDTTKQYYLTKFARYDENIDQGQYISQLLWLKNKRILSSEEYERLIEEFRLRRLF